MGKKISFIIISYNEKEYLPQAIESCINQGLIDYEIIIGDDGSSDGSLEIIKGYQEKYPTLIKHFVSDRSDVCKETLIASLRVSAVIERALKTASGEYCIILSGDDYLYEGEFIARAAEFLDQNHEYVAYVGGYEKVWPDQPSVQFFSNYSPNIYWSGGYIHLTAFVFRKKVFDDGCFLQRFCDDAGLVYALAFSGKWKYENHMVFAYRQRSSSIMHTVDQMEFRIVELMIFQDVLCKGYLLNQSRAHYAKSLWYVFEHRRNLEDEKYCKYLKNCEQYDHDIIKMLKDYDKCCRTKKVSIYLQLLYARILAKIYKVVRVLGKK